MIDDTEMQKSLFYETPKGLEARRRLLGLLAGGTYFSQHSVRVTKIYRTTSCALFRIPVVIMEDRPWGPRSVGDRWSRWEPDPGLGCILVSMRQLGDTGILIGSWEDHGKLCLVVNDTKSKVELWEPGEGP